MKWLVTAIGAAIVLSIVVVVITRSGSKVPSAQPQALTATGTTTTITTAAPLVDNLSGDLKIAGSTSMQPLSTQLASAFMKKHPNVKITVVGGSTGSGLGFAQDGSADIGAVSRVLTAAEMSAYRNYVIAMEGVVIIANPSNKVASLTMDQARQIFDGQIVNWQDVGGGNATIDLFTRERGAGARAVFQDILMRKDSFSTSAGIQTSTEAMRSTVAGDPNAIGFISLGDLDQSVRALALQGVQPSMQTVFNGAYKISRPFFYVTKDEPQGLTKAFIDFVLSPEGQAVVEDAKLVKAQ
jgi:phosphate transport system substrate-binding protein